MAGQTRHGAKISASQCLSMISEQTLRVCRGKTASHFSGSCSGNAKRRQKLQHLTVQANGAAFHVARTGTGQPLLLLHGWPEFWLTWEPVMTRLADRFQLIAPDLRSEEHTSEL